MQTKRRLTWLWFLLPVFFLIFLIILIQFQDAIYQGLLLPLSESWFYARLVINSVSQEVYFALLLLIVTVTAFGIILGLYLRAEAMGGNDRPLVERQVSRARYWTELIYVRNPIQYTRELMNNEVRRLLLSHYGFETEVDREVIEGMMARGELNVPPEVVPYLSKRRHEWSRPEKRQKGIAKLLHRLGERFRQPAEQNTKIEPIDPQLERVVSYLESQLEVADDTGR